MASDGDDNGVAVNDARTVVATAAGGAFVGFAAEKFYAEIAFKARLPDGFAISQIQAAKFSGAGEDVSAIVIDDRCGARARAPFVLENRGVGNVPNFFTR